MFLKRKGEKFSSVFFTTHRRHVRRLILKSVVYFAISGTLASLFVLAALFGKGTIVEACVAVAIFLWICVGICLGLPRSLQVRLVPYFEQRLGDADTWARGKSLLEYSRHLDALATSLEAQPLSAFASGDDLIPGEMLVWFEPLPALATVEKLLESAAAKDFSSDLTADLSALRAALKLALKQQVRFGLLLREGSSISGAEMDRRKGSFF